MVFQRHIVHGAGRRFHGYNKSLAPLGPNMNILGVWQETNMAKLGVNIDHVATLRQARRASEPDPVAAAVDAQLGGADLITVHLREDRRHIQDRDVELLRQTVRVPLNLEMAPVKEILAIALRLKPEMVTLVPEKRAEITTEDGLDVRRSPALMRRFVGALRDAGIIASAFISADKRQVQAAHRAGFDVCEIHTGTYANASAKTREAQLEKVRSAGEATVKLGMRFNAGHGLNYNNVAAIAALPNVNELHIGHAIVSRAVFTGLRQAVADMKSAIRRAVDQ
jgi:pyridoxine 5-phosphate synthase